MTGPGHDASCVLSDGRILEYWDGGDPGGRAVIFHPGTPVTRVLARWAHEAAISAGVRLVAVNRPGYGKSTPVAGAPSLLAGGGDTAALCTLLGIDEYGVVGSSGGGPFAAATSIADPGRVHAVGIVAGIGPWRLIDEPTDADAADLACLSLLDGGDLTAARDCLLASAEDDMGGMRALDDQARVDAFFSDFDTAVLADRYRVLWAANLAEVLRGFDGYVDDNLAWGGAWDIDLADVAAPTVLWYGDADKHTTLMHARWYADRIPGSRLEVLAGEEHIGVCDGHWPTVLSTVCEIWS